jgi:hypothetical protein
MILGMRMAISKPSSAAPDVTAPTLVSATINAAGNRFTLVFSEAVTGTEAGFNANGGVGSFVFTSLASGSGTTTLVFIPDVIVMESEGAVSLNYDGGDIVDLASNPLATIENFPVTNNSTATPTDFSVDNTEPFSVDTITFTNTTVPSGGDLWEKSVNGGIWTAFNVQSTTHNPSGNVDTLLNAGASLIGRDEISIRLTNANGVMEKLTYITISEL